MVVTKPDTAQKRGRTLREPLVKEIAERYNIPVLQPDSKQQLISNLNQYTHIKHGVVSAYGMILPSEVLRNFESNLINIHASLLPRWRGPSPIESAILHGDERTGITLMQLVETMDAGPIYAQSALRLDGTETKPWLYQRLAELGRETLLNNIDDFLYGSLQSTPQDEKQATYSKLLRKSDGVIDWQQPAAAIERQVRAFLGWPGSHTTVHGVSVTIESARVIEKTGTPGKLDVIDGSLVIYARENALLIDKIKPSGKNAMNSTDFVRGYLK